jgi:Pectate lyase superfamily protein
VGEANAQPPVIPTNYSYPPGNLLRYGADPSGNSPSQAALQNAIASNTVVYAPGGTYLLTAGVYTAKSPLTIVGDSRGGVPGAGGIGILSSGAYLMQIGNHFEANLEADWYWTQGGSVLFNSSIADVNPGRANYCNYPSGGGCVVVGPTYVQHS